MLFSKQQEVTDAEQTDVKLVKLKKKKNETSKINNAKANQCQKEKDFGKLSEQEPFQKKKGTVV